jgi:hypothetical protein
LTRLRLAEKRPLSADHHDNKCWHWPITVRYKIFCLRSINTRYRLFILFSGWVLPCCIGSTAENIPVLESGRWLVRRPMMTPASFDVCCSEEVMRIRLFFWPDGKISARHE